MGRKAGDPSCLGVWAHVHELSVGVTVAFLPPFTPTKPHITNSLYPLTTARLSTSISIVTSPLTGIETSVLVTPPYRRQPRPHPASAASFQVACSGTSHTGIASRRALRAETPSILCHRFTSPTKYATTPTSWTASQAIRVSTRTMRSERSRTRSRSPRSTSPCIRWRTARR